MNVKKIVIFIVTLLAAISFVGCQGNVNSGVPLEMRMIDVDLQLPETYDPGKELRIEATVTLKEETVEDANEVNFELWRQGDGDDSVSYPGEHIGDGVYAIDYTFEEDGVYYVVSHVTVEEMHRMLKKKIIVGEVSQEELEAEDSYTGSM